ncbi:MAG: uroporphyrinogen decarboxylase family protein [Peptoniphilus sp.]|nr:uroporphyrinogen decarboxylase family protein [Peptoniphilus sp.]MDD7362858.1 uroporphyrinogen decarboxylase family protein [Bacillota bacterium]MDY6043950.1 uroporphyrinogen decarboxylase family protein [Peptoniphilus sp.]
MTIRDYRCRSDDQAGVDPEIVKKLGLSLPEGHKHAESIYDIALETKKAHGRPFCELPFCHTVEAEAMGGHVNYGDERTGPRAADYVCDNLEEVLELQSMDFSEGRIHEVLEASRKLSEDGERVSLEIAGPLTMLNVLVDARKVFRAMRKDKDLVRDVFDKLHRELIAYAREAVKSGVYMISYADSAAGVNILGPKMAKELVDDFTYDFLKELQEVTAGKTVVHLCPKTSLMLVDTGKATFVDIDLPDAMSYGEAIDYIKDTSNFVGQMCIQNLSREMGTKQIKTIVLNEF